jgi:prepilin-type N-terminal cleavage/methylation domain-containing protein
MNKRKGFTLIEVIVIVVILTILTVIGGCITICVKGCNKAVDTIEASVADKDAAYAARLVSNPPQYAIGDIVYHKATDGKMIVAKNACSWNEIKDGWNIKVKDGGNMDKIGGFGMNENEVKATLDDAPEV